MNFIKILPLLFISTTIFSQVNLDSGLIARYPLNGSANDVSVSAANGVVENATATTDKFNLNNKAFQFQKSANTRIKVPYSNKLDVSAGKLFSASFWVYVDSYAGINATLLYYGSLYASNYSLILLNNSTADSGKVVFTNYIQNNNPSVLVDISSGSPLQKNTWYFIALTIDGTPGASSTKLYINNLLSAQSSNSVIIPTSSTASANLNSSILNIGNHADIDWGFNGKIDEVRIYNRILTYPELESLQGGFAGMHNKTVEASEKLSVYPNPAENELNIDIPFETKSEITIFDNVGKEVLKITASDLIKIDVSNWAQGVYNIRVINDKQVTETKFVKGL